MPASSHAGGDRWTDIPRAVIFSALLKRKVYYWRVPRMRSER
jgi:hypothetical protein